MRHKYTRMILVTIAVLGCGAVVAASLGSVARDEVLPQRVLTVATSQLKPVTTYTTLRVYTGTLVAARTAELSFERAAEVTALHADQGDRVAQGELLATLKTKGLQAKRGQLVAQRARRNRYWMNLRRARVPRRSPRHAPKCGTWLPRSSCNV